MRDAKNQNLKNILSLSEEKLHVLGEILHIALKIKDEADKACRTDDDDNADDAIENIASFVGSREELFEQVNNIELSLKHYGAQLCAQDQETVGELERIEQTVGAEIKIVVENIKAADETNSQKIAELMEIIKAKIKAVKGNRALMDRYVGDNEVPSAGTLLSEKK